MKPRVALVHDWLIHMRGGEKVLEALAEIYPDAVIYTLFCDRSKLSPVFQNMRIETSFLNSLPGIKKYYRWLLPLMPLAIRSLKIEPADIVISSSHCVAKGAAIPAGAVHFCYCHTPMRYLWGFEQEYFGKLPAFMRSLIRSVFKYLREFDLASNKAVDHFVANAENVKARIRKYYDRDAHVVYPPVNLSDFKPMEERPKEPYYFAVSAFVPYKRIDLVIEAFNRLDKRLLIVGSGPMEAAYRKLRRSEKISFLGSVSGPELRRLYSGAQAVLFPTEEDFGIVPLEAQACGTPVIAFGKGGALESVKTGVFFPEQTAESLAGAVEEFEKKTFERDKIPPQVESFSKEHFKAHMKTFIEERVRPHEAHR